MAIVGKGGLVNVRVQLNQTTASQIVTNLRRLTSRKMLETVSLEKEEDDLLDKMYEVFPRSSDPPNRSDVTDRIYAKWGLKHLIHGWKAVTERKQYGYSLRLAHQAYRRNYSKMRDVLYYIDKGTQSKVYMTGEKWTAFPDKKMGKEKMVFIRPGTLMLHAATPATEYTQKVTDYLLRVLIPRVRAKVRKAVTTAADGTSLQKSIRQRFSKN